MFRVKYTYKKEVMTKTFYTQKEFHVFLGMIRKNSDVKNIEILPSELNPILRKVA